MSIYVPAVFNTQKNLLHYFMLHISSTETYRVLVNGYGYNAPSNRGCREWFQRFRNNGFDVKNEERAGAPT